MNIRGPAMMEFRYTAIERDSGRTRRGRIRGTDEREAARELKMRGLHPLALRPEDERVGTHRFRGRAGARRFAGLRRPGSERELTLFTRQLAVLLHAGLPLVKGIDLLARQAENPRWRSVLEDLAGAIRGGGTFGGALARRPKIFDQLYCGMVRAGETGGALDAALDRLARHLEKRGRVTAQVRSAMTYPVVILLVALGVVAGLVVFVVPRFEAIFAGVLRGAPLPVLTQWVLGASRAVQGHWLAVLALGILTLWGGRCLRRTRLGSRALDQALLRLPLVGTLRLKTAIARFSRALGAMLASGVPILDALQLSREACGSWTVTQAAGVVQRRVRDGEGVAQPLEDTGLFPPVVAGMVEVGEETGNLPAMLTRLADLYEDEVDAAVTGLTSLIEPAMIVLMAFVVGTVVISLFLPIVRIIQMLD